VDKAAQISWRFLVIVAAITVLVYALVQLRLIVLPVIVAMFLATILAPPSHWLIARGWPPLLAAWAIVLGGVVVVAGAITIMGPQVAGELGQMGADVKQGAQQVVAWLTEGPLDMSQEQVDRYVDGAARALRESSSTIGQGVLAGAIKAVEIVAAIVLTLVLTFFFVKDGKKMWEWFTNQFNAAHRMDVREIGTRAWTTLGAYVRGTALVALVDAVLIGIALILVGVPLVLPLALLTFLGGFFPIVGAFVAGLVASLVALVTGGVVDALIIAAAVTAIQQIEGDVLQPMIMGRALKLHPVVVLLALTAGGILAGVAGAFLAVPLSAVGAVVGGYLKSERTSAG
jgi:putative heme transporter